MVSISFSFISNSWVLTVYFLFPFSLVRLLSKHHCKCGYMLKWANKDSYVFRAEKLLLLLLWNFSLWRKENGVGEYACVCIFNYVLKGENNGSCIFVCMKWKPSSYQCWSKVISLSKCLWKLRTNGISMHTLSLRNNLSCYTEVWET